jgi:hypothetical protein
MPMPVRSSPACVASQPPKGSAWVPYIDGRPVKSIGKLTLTTDTVIEWKIEKTEKPVKPEKPVEK